MAKAKPAKRRWTMKDVKRIFGPDYVMPTVEEMENSPRMTIEEVLSSWKKLYPPRRKSTNRSVVVCQLLHEVQKIKDQISSIEKLLIDKLCMC